MTAAVRMLHVSNYVLFGLICRNHHKLCTLPIFISSLSSATTIFVASERVPKHWFALSNLRSFISPVCPVSSSCQQSGSFVGFMEQYMPSAVTRLDSLQIGPKTRHTYSTITSIELASKLQRSEMIHRKNAYDHFHCQWFLRHPFDAPEPHIYTD